MVTVLRRGQRRRPWLRLFRLQCPALIFLIITWDLLQPDDVFFTAEETNNKPIPNIEFTDLNVTVATWDYFPPNIPQSVQEPNLTSLMYDNYAFCQEFLKAPLATTLPRRRRTTTTKQQCPSKGILHIQYGDVGGASATIFFQFVIGMLRWAEQHQYTPFVHLNDHSKVIYDPKIHSVGSFQGRFQAGIEIGWARDAQDPLGYIFPGKPKLQPNRMEVQNNTLFTLYGTGVWEHYFEPVSNEFSVTDTTINCSSTPLVTMNFHHILPGLHSQAPWVPHGWKYWMPPHIQRADLPMSEWLQPQRQNASEIVQRYIRFNPYMEQRSICALVTPPRKNHTKLSSETKLLGIHIRHGDKYPSRNYIKTRKFLPYVQDFLQVYPENGLVYLATDSSKVWSEIQQSWPISDRIIRQSFVQGTSPNRTAAFELGISPHRTNIEALTDIRALSKCHFLLHGWSAMTEAAFYLNPKLVGFDLENDEEPMNVTYFRKRISE